jgi:hypothetical protein
MARIKPRKRDLTKIPDKHSNQPKGTIQNVGGHIVDPPEDCPYRKQWSDGGIWTDLGCCQVCCTNRCKRYQWYKRATKHMRVEDLRNKGVYYPWN